MTLKYTISREFKNLKEDENGDLLTYSHNILNRCKNNISQPFNVYRVSDVWKIEIHREDQGQLIHEVRC
jgi:hypothetical protein